MDKYICPCGYVYDPEKGDPEHGIKPGTAWEDIPDHTLISMNCWGFTPGM